MKAKEVIKTAASEGEISLNDIPDGDMFDSVGEFIEYASENECEELAYSLGLADDNRGDIHEIEETKALERAYNAGLI